jgi:cellulose 1,4-beta-cellobiosidase
MGDSLNRGMVLALSIWDDYAVRMLWLDSNYPTDKDPSLPGISRGPCPTDSGDPATIEKEQGSATVTYSNIKIGDIGTTYSGGTSPGTPGSSTTTTSTSTSQPGGPTQNPGTVPQWGQVRCIL